jgi:tetratricopeptide (TPR) repeat protein
VKYGTQISENLKNVQRLLRENQYSKSLLIVNKLLEKYPFSTRLLLLKGQLIQLLDEDSELGELRDALDALESAVELDGESIDALNELAMFRYVVEDKHDEAMLLFEKSIVKCLEFLEEAYLGKAKCLFETDRVFESLNCLNEGLQLIPHAAKLKSEKDYILSIVQGTEK